jgi:uncharacterized membrane protein
MWLLAEPDASVTYALMLLASRFAAPMFLFIVGLCLTLSAEKRSSRKAAEHILMRGIFLIATGFILNLIIYAPATDINILHTIGLSMILLSPAAINPSAPKSAAALAGLILLSLSLPHMPQLNDALAASQFPILPWMIFTAFGLMAGQSISQLQKSGETKKVPHILEAAAVVLMLSAAALLMTGDEFRYYPATWSYITLTTALVLYVLAVAYWAYEVLGKRLPMLRPLETYGRYAYIIYFGHHLFVATIPAQLGLLNKFTETETIGYMILFLAASFLLLDSFEKKRDKERRSH